MNVLCAPFLYVARSEAEAFAIFHRFITKECPGYLRGAMDGVHKGVALVDRCLAVVDSKLSSHLINKGVKAEIYAFASVLTMCAATPPLPEVLHLWDFLFAYGAHLNILCICAQLLIMKEDLLSNSRSVQPRAENTNADDTQPRQLTSDSPTFGFQKDHHVDRCISAKSTQGPV